VKKSYQLLKQNNDECILDKVTGLIWEQKQEAGSGTLRSNSWGYTWYDLDDTNNGGNRGYQNSNEYYNSNSEYSSCGVSAPRRFFMYYAVKWFGKGAF
jgi:hypothetical protein